MAERLTCARAQPFSQFNRRFVRATGQHDMRQRVELVFDGCVDFRMGVAEKIDPPGTVGIEIALSFGIK